MGTTDSLAERLEKLCDDANDLARGLSYVADERDYRVIEADERLTRGAHATQCVDRLRAGCCRWDSEPCDFHRGVYVGLTMAHAGTDGLDPRIPVGAEAML